jgi:methylated-DNA-protein-cysteine methyltransferase-like protein
MKINNDEVFEIVKKIPKGKVSTYKDIAIALGNKNLARVVGNILHTNIDKYGIPCYKVVTSQGRLSKSYALGGITEQKRLLENDGIVVENDHVKLTKYLFNNF